MRSGTATHATATTTPMAARATKRGAAFSRSQIRPANVGAAANRGTANRLNATICARDSPTTIVRPTTVGTGKDAPQTGKATAQAAARAPSSVHPVCSSIYGAGNASRRTATGGALRAGARHGTLR